MLDKITDIIIQELIAPAITLLFALATLIFFWGLIRYLIHADNEDERTKGRSLMIYGAFGMFIMFSAGGIMTVICSFFNSFCLL